MLIVNSAVVSFEGLLGPAYLVRNAVLSNSEGIES